MVEAQAPWIFLLIGVAVLGVSGAIYVAGVRTKHRRLKWKAAKVFLFGCFGLVSLYTSWTAMQGPKYFEANLDVNAEGRVLCVIPVTEPIGPKSLSIRARARDGNDARGKLALEIEVSSEIGGKVILSARPTLDVAGKGEWEVWRQILVPQLAGDHLVKIQTSNRVGTVQVLVER